MSSDQTDLLAFVEEAEWSVRVLEEGFISTAKDSINALNSENILVGRPNCIIWLSVQYSLV